VAGASNPVKILAHTEVSVDVDMTMEFCAGFGASSKSEETLDKEQVTETGSPKRRLSERRTSIPRTSEVLNSSPEEINKQRRRSIPRNSGVLNAEALPRRNSRRSSLPRLSGVLVAPSEEKIVERRDSGRRSSLPRTSEVLDAAPIQKQSSRGSLLESMKKRMSLLDQQRSSLVQHMSDMSIAMQEVNAEKYTRKRLCVTCVLGSMDDLVIQTILLISDTVQWYHLLIGNFLGSLIVLIVCFLGSKIRGFSECMSCFPLWLVIGTFSIYCMVFTFLE